MDHNSGWRRLFVCACIAFSQFAFENRATRAGDLFRRRVAAPVVVTARPAYPPKPSDAPVRQFWRVPEQLARSECALDRVVVQSAQ